MITDLFTSVSGVDPEAIIRAIPPSCRREHSAATLLTVATGELLLEFPAWRPRAAARHFLPALSVLTRLGYAVRFELSVETGTGWSGWVAGATLGSGEFSPLPAANESLECDIDVYTTREPVGRVRFRARLAASDSEALVAAPWIVTVSACDVSTPVSGAVPSSVRLDVPARSQLDAPAEIALRICSPVCVAMVLEYWGAAAATLPLAAEIFHADTDRYGVWPAAIKAAGRHGVAGYLLRFPDWSSVAWCLERRQPIIASINYTAGELTGAPMPATSGHLVVLTGFDGDDVLVNDPAAPTQAEVPRRYRLAELQRVWLERTGVGYVLFRP